MKVQEYKVKVSSKSNELQFIADEKEITVAEADALRTYAGYDDGENGKISQIVSKHIASAVKEVKETIKSFPPCELAGKDVRKEVTDILSKSIEMWATDAINEAGGRKSQNLAVVALRAIPRLVKEQVATGDKPVASVEWK